MTKMKSVLFLIIAVLISALLVAPFRVFSSYKTRSNVSLGLKAVSNSIPSNEKEYFRNNLSNILSRAVITSASVISLGGLECRADSLETVNTKLASYQLPPILYVPNGFSPVVSEYGRGNIREQMSNPILVQFVYPQLWVVQKTSVNNNGESGTISANDYIKGDSAFLFVQKIKESKPQLNKETITAYILKALSQKGDPTESLRVLQIADGPVGSDGSSYKIVDFAYQLNTEAGFLISRRGVLSVTAVGEASIQGLLAVTTDKRFGSLEKSLRTISESFRAYRLNSGIFAANE